MSMSYFLLSREMLNIHNFITNRLVVYESFGSKMVFLSRLILKSGPTIHILQMEISSNPTALLAKCAKKLDIELIIPFLRSFLSIQINLNGGSSVSAQEGCWNCKWEKESVFIQLYSNCWLGAWAKLWPGSVSANTAKWYSASNI